MKDLTKLDPYRVIDDRFAPSNPKLEGLFVIPSVVDKVAMHILCSGSRGWDHVSVSRPDRIPEWIEMEQVKRTFFNDDECALQLHPPTAQYITGVWPGRRSLFCLHLWKPHDLEIPRPPRWMVGANSEHEWRIALKSVPKDTDE